MIPSRTVKLIRHARIHPLPLPMRRFPPAGTCYRGPVLSKRQISSTLFTSPLLSPRCHTFTSLSVPRRASRELIRWRNWLTPARRSYVSHRRGRASFSLPEGDGIVYALIGANVLVFGAWTYASQSRKLTRWMVENFTVSGVGVVEHGRIHTLFTAMFSHQSFTHLLVNCVTLYFFGAEGEEGGGGVGWVAFVVETNVSARGLLSFCRFLYGCGNGHFRPSRPPSRPPPSPSLICSLFPPAFPPHVFRFHLLAFDDLAAVLLGARRFINLYFAGGLASSLGCVAWPYLAPT
jgi:membrane associated rhomboid family serine protease